MNTNKNVMSFFLAYMDATGDTRRYTVGGWPK